MRVVVERAVRVLRRAERLVPLASPVATDHELMVEGELVRLFAAVEASGVLDLTTQPHHLDVAILHRQSATESPPHLRPVRAVDGWHDDPLPRPPEVGQQPATEE